MTPDVHWCNHLQDAHVCHSYRWCVQPSDLDDLRPMAEFHFSLSAAWSPTFDRLGFPPPAFPGPAQSSSLHDGSLYRVSSCYRFVDCVHHFRGDTHQMWPTHASACFQYVPRSRTVLIFLGRHAVFRSSPSWWQFGHSGFDSHQPNYCCVVLSWPLSYLPVYDHAVDCRIFVVQFCRKSNYHSYQVHLHLQNLQFKFSFVQDVSSQNKFYVQSKPAYLKRFNVDKQ